MCLTSKREWRPDGSDFGSLEQICYPEDEIVSGHPTCQRQTVLCVGSRRPLFCERCHKYAMSGLLASSLFLLFATPAAAQSTAEDGMRAMLRGGYPAALRILRPLADDTAHPDPAAQFFPGILTDTDTQAPTPAPAGCFSGR
jgi:hypothetical protein